MNVVAATLIAVSGIGVGITASSIAADARVQNAAGIHLAQASAPALGLSRREKADKSDRARQLNLPAQVIRLSTQIRKLGARLQQLDARLTRAQRAVPTPEEFREQTAEGRKAIEKRRAAVEARWRDVERIAKARGVNLEGRSLRNVVPEALAADEEFLKARARAVEETQRTDALEERLIKVMLTTTFGDLPAVTQMVPEEKAIAQERQNLAANQKSFAAAVQDAQRKSAAAKVEFDPAELFDPAGAPAPKGDAALIKAREQAAIRLGAREASAELVATLEFLKAVGPVYKPW